MGSVKQRFATELWELAGLIRATSTRREFVSRAYRQAIWSLDWLSPELDEPVAVMLEVPGIGPGVARLIQEFRADGHLGELTKLAEKLPRETGRLQALPRMTPRRLRWLKTELAVETEQDLIAAIRLDRLRDLKGVGPDTTRTWLGRLEPAPPPGLTPFAGRRWSHLLAAHIERHVEGADPLVSGAVRRFEDWVAEIDLVVARPGDVIRFLEQSAVVTGFLRIEGAMRFETLGARVNVHDPGPSATTAATLFRTTGPPGHVAAIVRSIGGDTPLDSAATEQEIYRAAGTSFVPPPARRQAIDAPADLVAVQHLRGDLHLHSDWSPDGRQTIEEIVLTARSNGLEYVGITDHAKGLRFGGLDEERIGQQRLTIETLQRKYPDIRILQGSELNIDRLGDLDFDDGVLRRLDFAIAAVHSFFTLDRADQTSRVLRAIANPYVNVVAHLTGRRVGIRPPIDLDLDLVLDAAAGNQTALEVNGHLDRMDISPEIVSLAGRRDALFAANSDAHRSNELANVANSIGILQRGWAIHPRVVNTWAIEDLLDWVGRSRPPVSRQT